MALKSHETREISIFVIIFIFGLWLSLGTAYRQAGQILWGFSLFLLVLWLFFRIVKIPYLKVNGVKGNTPKAMLTALIGILVVIAGSTVTGIITQGWTVGSAIDFLSPTTDSGSAFQAAVLGSSQNPFEDSPPTRIGVFVGGFPISETVITIFMFSLILYLFKLKLDIKNKFVWIVAVLLSFFAMAYHFFAKQLASGSPDWSALIVIGWIFFVEIMMAVITKEAEPSIWHHIFNNALALGLFFIFNTLLSLWWLVVLIIIVVIVVNSNKIKIKRFIG